MIRLRIIDIPVGERLACDHCAEEMAIGADVFLENGEIFCGPECAADSEP